MPLLARELNLLVDARSGQLQQYHLCKLRWGRSAPVKCHQVRVAAAQDYCPAFCPYFWTSSARLVAVRVASGNDPFAQQWVLHHLARLFWVQGTNRVPCHPGLALLDVGLHVLVDDALALLHDGSPRYLAVHSLLLLPCKLVVAVDLAAVVLGVG